jgi:hypothetical protein
MTRATVTRLAWCGVLLIVLCAPVAAVAGAGWYLLEPPVEQTERDGKRRLLLDDWYHLPENEEGMHWRIAREMRFADWLHKASFDSAAACESDRKKRGDNAARSMRESIEREKKEGKKVPTVSVTRYAAVRDSRCIASDGPRLAPGMR